MRIFYDYNIIFTVSFEKKIRFQHIYLDVIYELKILIVAKASLITIEWILSYGFSYENCYILSYILFHKEIS